MRWFKFLSDKFAPFALGLCLLTGGGIWLIAAGLGYAEQNRNAEIKSDVLNISYRWPILHITDIDDESAAFVKNQVAQFEEFVTEMAAEMATSESDLDPPLCTYELSVDYTLSMPSNMAVSILWEIWQYTGGAHGDLNLVSGNYDLQTGFPLLLEDLFVDPALAIVQFSRISRRELAARNTEEQSLGDMYLAGTEPDNENFAVFTLTPTGVRVHFPPYQVGPWAAGIQSVDVSLEELSTARPKYVYWGR